MTGQRRRAFDTDTPPAAHLIASLLTTDWQSDR